MSSRTQFDWSGVRADPQFQAFNRRRRAFLFALFGLALSVFLILPVMAAYFPAAMAYRVFGAVNVGILLALAEFVMAWLIAWAYTRRANRDFDPQAEKIFLMALDSYRKR